MIYQIRLAIFVLVLHILSKYVKKIIIMITYIFVLLYLNNIKMREII